jgi:diadenosine tetraphosphate (Ap4A) HIT family hydrolase
VPQAACDFCDELAGGQKNAYRLLCGRHAPERLVCQTPDLVAVPSLGGLGVVHVLVLPIRHVPSFAGASRSERAGARAMIVGLMSALARPGCEWLIFEHGLADELSTGGGCGISHAHLHLVLVPAQCLPAPPPHPAPNRWRRLPVGDWIEALPHGADYLLWGTRHDLRVATVPSVPSQFLRAWIAGATGQRWDWRLDTGGRSFVDRIARLRDTLLDEARGVTNAAQAVVT